MSSSSNHNPQQPAQHANAPTEPFPTSFTLISEEGDCIDVDPLVLAGTSKVFADMLRSGTGAEKSCRLAEKTEDVEMYLEAIEEGVDCEISEEDWLLLFTMADKYDSKILRGALKQVFNPKPAQDYDEAQSAYAAAFILGDRDLAEATAFAALHSLSRNQDATSVLFEKLPQLERFRLENYGHRYLQALRDLLLSVDPKRCDEHTSTARSSAKFVQLHWDKARVYALAHLNYEDRLLRNLKRQIAHSVCYSSCGGCDDRLNDALAKVEKEWETGAKGKKSVKLF
ncbi:hypothetical protein JCM8097_009328 [Rhodosporidiobolus ruineniae]